MRQPQPTLLASFFWGLAVAACSSSEPEPQPTSIGGAAVAVGGGKVSPASTLTVGGGLGMGGGSPIASSVGVGGTVKSSLDSGLGSAATSLPGNAGRASTAQANGGNPASSRANAGDAAGARPATSTPAAGGRTSTGIGLGGAANSNAVGGRAAAGSKSTGGAGNSGSSSGGSTSTGKLEGGTSSAGKATGGAVTGGAASGGTAVVGAAGADGCTPPAIGSKGKNPLFSDVYTADPGALVHNCTFYINCGHDEGDGTGFVMRDWFILKSTDMVNWTRIDKALGLSDFKWSDGNAWAGQMVTKGGKFYWFVPVNKRGTCPNNCGMAIGVAVGDSPEGPFKDYLNAPLIDDKLEMSNWNFSVDSDTPYTIDPTAFVDDDGQAYYLYGGFGRLVGGKVSLDGNNVTLDGKIQNVSGADGFFEAAYLTKNKGKYYVIYAAGSNPASIDYATASSPLGPYKYGGRILDPLTTTSKDAATSHPAVAEFAGQWYLVYHVSNGPNGGGTYHREVAIEKLNFDASGKIQKVTPSSGLSF